MPWSTTLVWAFHSLGLHSSIPSKTSEPNPLPPTGAQLDPQYHAGTLTMREMWLQSWNVNTVGTQILTSTFIPLLLHSPSPRILFLTSGTSTLKGTENSNLHFNKAPEAGWPKKVGPGVSSIPAYRSSKCGMNMMMRGMPSFFPSAFLSPFSYTLC